MDYSGQNVQRLTTDGTTMRRGFLASHPDHDRLAWQRIGGAGEIYLTDGATTRQIAVGERPSFTSDGNWVCYTKRVTDANGVTGELHVADTRGGRDRLIPGGAAYTFDTQASWSW